MHCALRMCAVCMAQVQPSREKNPRTRSGFRGGGRSEISDLRFFFFFFSARAQAKSEKENASKALIAAVERQDKSLRSQAELDERITYLDD